MLTVKGPPMPLVLLERQQRLAIVTLNDPKRLNAMGEQMAREFRAVTQDLCAEPPGVIIVTGAGRAFSAGGDLKMLERRAGLSYEQNRREMLEFYTAFLSIREPGVPVVAAINGHAVGAGLCLVCACDFRVADPSAELSAPFLRLGLYPGMGSTYLLPRVLGTAIAADVLLTGRRMHGWEALRIGFVSRLAEPGHALELARAVAAEVLAGQPQVTSTLLSHLRGDGKELARALELEAEEQARSYAGQEFQEGLRAALEARSRARTAPASGGL